MEEEWVEYDGGAVQEWHRNASRIRMAPGVTVIPESAFERYGYPGAYDPLRAVDLCNVTTISARAFFHCTSLEHIIWPAASAVEIGISAFAYCKSLRGIDLGNVTKIGSGAFYRCEALERVTIPSNVALIEPNAFEDCENLTEAELSEGIRRIGMRAFLDCCALARINLPSSIISIEARAFRGCRSLVEVELSEGLQHIGARAFQGCTSLIRISIPATTLNIQYQAFAQCNELTSVVFQEGLNRIGEESFRDCDSLERVTIPSSTTSIGPYAFVNCMSLSEVTLCEGVLHVGDDNFNDCPTLQHVNIPPVALVIDIWRRVNDQLMRTTMPVPVPQKLVVSKWMQYRSTSEVEEAKAKVNEIMGRRWPAWDEKIALIRTWFAYYDRLDVTTMLELAIWKCNMDGNEQGAEARQEIREYCGSDMNIIIPGALQFLDSE